MHPLNSGIAEAIDMAAKTEAFDGRGVHDGFNWHSGL